MKNNNNILKITNIIIHDIVSIAFTSIKRVSESALIFYTPIHVGTSRNT